jgi:DNA-binding NarL/FixJ family response regulator
MSSQVPVRVAIASDQPIYRLGLSAFLRSLKYVQLVGEAGDDAEALQLASLTEPDIILLDLKLSPQKSKDIAFAIRQRWPDTRTVILMNSQEEAQSHEVIPGDPHFYFSKDISEDELALAIRQIRDGGEALRGIEDTPIEPVEVSAAVVSIPVQPSHQRPPRRQTEEIRLRELLMAGRIQADILPEKAPSLPGWDISARLRSARETSGDFYDFIPMPNGSLGIVVADVTDKGIGAALFMALSSTLIRTFAVRYPTLPALAMDMVNERILTDTRGSLFVTAFYGVLEPQLGRLRYVNAGHPPACLVSLQRGKPVDHLPQTGIPLGVMEKAHWQQKIVRLSVGDVLLIYTDGVTEAQNKEGVMYGEQRLMEELRLHAGKPARQIQEAIFEAVQRFTGGSSRQDDIAVVVLRRI